MDHERDIQMNRSSVSTERNEPHGRVSAEGKFTYLASCGRDNSAKVARIIVEFTLIDSLPERSYVILVLFRDKSKGVPLIEASTTAGQ